MEDGDEAPAAVLLEVVQGEGGVRLGDPAFLLGAQRLCRERGALLIADLGSTNGSWVNDRRVQEMALGEGDRIRIGDTILIVESMEPG